MRRSIVLIYLSLAAGPALAAAPYVVHTSEVSDQKAVIATVEPVHRIVARARNGGTVAALNVREGDEVTAGQEIAAVGDPKLALQLQAIDSRIQSQAASRDKAKLDLARVQELRKTAVSSQAQLDAAQTALDIAERTLTAMQSDRGVIVQQMKEGAVLAPGAGRVLTVNVSDGRVVLPGETIATIAQDRYVLRLQLPERHAQFLRAGDKVLIGSRGLGDDAAARKRDGVVRLVYPEIEGGRVIADVDVAGLGNYFIGERTRVWVSTGRRSTIVIPKSFLIHRAGVNLVKSADGGEIVVQPGETRGDEVEILSGLADGDRLVQP